MHTSSLRPLLIGITLAGLLAGRPAWGDNPLPVGSAPAPLELPWFPTRMHAFVWRNWELADLARMARVLGTTPDKLSAVGASMGLPPHTPVPESLRNRSYITLIRRNWHLLSYEQLLQLLDWTPQQLAHALREDDFLWVKLGSLKPAAQPLAYTEPDADALQRAAEIKSLIEARLGDELKLPARERFAFVDALSAPQNTALATRPASGEAPIRLVYSYFAVYGDPLIDPKLDPYPDGLLEKLAARGVNAVWLHTVLRDLAPSRSFPEFGSGHETRLESLRRLVQRARRHGISVILYMNEPRAMPAGFFAGRPETAGVREGDYTTLCTSAPAVRRWLVESLTHVFREVPGLGGVFSISASENLTSCASHYQQAACPRCSKHTGAQIIADVNRAIAEGVWAGDPQARVIVWDWGWPDDWAESIIQALPDSVRLMSVSEWSLPIERGGVRSEVGEYSLSSVGPGPRARRHWGFAGKRGLRPMAKMQINCSWELSAVPCLPVLDLVAQHCDDLRRLGVGDWMLSWTVGGYPSPNLQVAGRFAQRPDASKQEILQSLAEERYGPNAAPHIRAAWTSFSTAFREYPFHVSLVYSGPLQCGPSNPLYDQPTGYRATMVGIPYDDLDTWRGIYPPEVLAQQLEKVAAGWQEGLARYADALPATAGRHREDLEADLRVAEAAGLHLASAAAQVRFILARNARRSPGITAEESDRLAGLMRRHAGQEIENASRLYAIAKRDPRIGFEASNHYYYVPTDLLEKIVNCDYVSRRLSR